MANYESSASIASGGEPGIMSNLLQNRLFLSYLSGAGSAMQQGEPVAPALNAITQQNIGAQSKAKANEYYMKMLKEILAGGGDVKLGKDKTTINAPSEMYGGVGSELGSVDPAKGSGMTASGSVDASYTPSVPEASNSSISSPSQLMERSHYLNPSASPLSGADLAGLTAADVSQALSGATGVQALRQKSLNDVADQTFRQRQLESIDRHRKQQIEESKARIGEIERGDRLDQPFISGYSLREYKSLPIKSKEYIVAREAARQRGEEFMSQREWENLEPTSREKFLRAAMADPELKKAAEDLAKAGATNIGEIVERGEKKADIKAKKYFTDPKGLTSDVEKYINSDDVQRRLFALDPSEQDKAAIAEKEKFIISKITGAGGKIDYNKTRVEGRTFVFVVTWPDGKTSEVRYAN